jgi:hypothetical protein
MKLKGEFMLQLTADDAVMAVLGKAKELAEIRDCNGTVIGFFAPVGIERADLYAEAAAAVDPSEIQRRKQAGHKTQTTQEVLAHLDSLEKC